MRALTLEEKHYLCKNMDFMPDEDLSRHLVPEAIASEGLDPHTINTIRYELEIVRPWRESRYGCRFYASIEERERLWSTDLNKGRTH